MQIISIKTDPYLTCSTPELGNVEEKRLSVRPQRSVYLYSSDIGETKTVNVIIGITTWVQELHLQADFRQK